MSLHVGIRTHSLGLALMPFIICAMGSCTSSAPSTTATSSDVTSGAETADGQAQVHQFHIELDYSMDSTGFFDAPERRKTLEAAAATWANMIRDDFEAVPVGTPIKVRNPSQPLEPSLKFDLKRPIDDLRLYVGCSTEDIKLGKAFISAYYPGNEVGAKLKERFKGDDYQPWAMSMAFHCDKPWFFDQTPETVDDLPKDRNDFLSTARHEIGHCLGLLNAAIAKSQVQTIDNAPYFTGKHAVQAFGGPVPLEKDARHIKNGLMSGGTEARMDPSTKKGTRKWPTPVDIAILKDIGYEIVSSKL